MAIGSLGQYLEDNTVENVVVDDVKVSTVVERPDSAATDFQADHAMERRYARVRPDKNVGRRLGPPKSICQRVL